MYDVIELLSQPGGELVLWDYCLEQNIFLPDLPGQINPLQYWMQGVDSKSGALYKAYGGSGYNNGACSNSNNTCNSEGWQDPSSNTPGQSYSRMSRCYRGRDWDD